MDVFPKSRTLQTERKFFKQSHKVLMNYGDEAGTRKFSYLCEKTWSKSLFFLVVICSCCFAVVFIYICQPWTRTSQKLQARWTNATSLVVWPSSDACAQPYHPSHGSTWAVWQLWTAVSAFLSRAERLKYFSLYSDDVINVEFKPSMSRARCLDYLEPKLSPSSQITLIFLGPVLE